MVLPQKLYSRTTFPIDSLSLQPPSQSDYNLNKPDLGHFLWASGNIGQGRKIETEWNKYVKSNLYSDTPQGLKPRGFSCFVSTKAYRATCRVSGGTTHTPINRSTILYHRRWNNASDFSKQVSG